jgi:hypothetical protein
VTLTSWLAWPAPEAAQAWLDGLFLPAALGSGVEEDARRVRVRFARLVAGERWAQRVHVRVDKGDDDDDDDDDGCRWGALAALALVGRAAAVRSGGGERRDGVAEAIRWVAGEWMPHVSLA